MELMAITERNFLYLNAGMTVSQARALLQATQTSHAILRGEGVEPHFYLFLTEELQGRLQSGVETNLLQETLDLRVERAALTADGASFVDDAPDVCIVLEGTHLVGYIDLTQSPLENVRLDNRDTTPQADLERYLAVEFSSRMMVGEAAQLDVYLAALGFGGKGKAIYEPAGTEIKIEAQVRRGFEPVGEVEGTLVVTTADESERLSFKFKATQVGTGELVVLAYLRGVEISRVRVVCLVKEAAPVAESSQVVVHQAAVETRLSAYPDLAVHIEQTNATDRVEYTFTLTAADPELELFMVKYGPHALGSNPGEYYEEFYEQIENLPMETPADRMMAEVELKAKGLELFTRMFPAEVQKLMWELRHRIRTVFVVSSEPWVPWELCRLVGEENGRKQEGEFFCEAFEITRWLPGTGLRQNLHLNNMAVVVPAGSGLAGTTLELAFLQTLANTGRKVSQVPARFIDLHNAFRLGVYDAWHFSGHGASHATNPNRAEILLEDGAYRAQNITGEAANLGLSRPVVFLNACQIGRGGASFAGQGGWAYQFLKAGAGAFIGALWSVYDEPAYRYAKELYTRLLSGAEFASAVRQARLAVRQEGDPTWLAYTAFAYPFARVS